MPSKLLNEREMYKPVCFWLESLLAHRNKRARVKAYDTSSVQLYRWLEQNGDESLFPEYLAYDIRVDVTGVIRTGTSAHLAFVECKLRPIRLKDISQLLGYCRVAQPQTAWIISPSGISPHVSYLLKAYHRYDVLNFDAAKRIRVAVWNHARSEIDASSVLPPGSF